MKFLFLTFAAWQFSLAAFCQQYQPDFSKEYPFPDRQTPFVYQKKTLPYLFRKKAPAADAASQPPLLEELVEIAVADTANETLAQRIYRKRLPSDAELFLANLKSGYKTGTGEVIIPAVYDELYSMETLVLAKKNGKWGMLDGRGGELLPFEWDFHESVNGFLLLSNGKRARVYTNEMKAILDEPATQVKRIFSYNNDLNLYQFEQQGQWNLFHTCEKLLVKGYFDGGRHFTDDLFALARDNQWWLFSLDGRKLSAEPYKEIEAFSKEHLDVFVVEKKASFADEEYLINSKGKILAGPFESISTPYSTDPRQDWVQVNQGGKQGIVNCKGAVVAPVVYDRIEDDYNGYYVLWKNGKPVQWLSQETGGITAEPPRANKK